MTEEVVEKEKSFEVDPLHANWEYSFSQGVLRLFTTLMFDLKVYNRHYVPKTGGVLMVSNHQSYLDPVLVGVYLRRPMSYLAKSGLFTNKFFGAWLRRIRAFPVKQGAGDVGAVKETIRRLKEGHMLNIFPEGSRSNDGEIAPMQAGASLVVKRANVPVIPCVVEGTFKAWPNKQKLPRPHPVRVMYGPPLDVSGLNAKEITALIDRTLRTMFEELRAKPRSR
jgi:1-acyl-sn-glycerol-3-phosphate acyltransferase